MLVRGVFVLSFFCFLQAEDGIRDLVRSRGLGDVYKRQADGLAIPLAVAARAAVLLREGGVLVMEHADSQGAVSYTHLTLPTSDLV